MTENKKSCGNCEHFENVGYKNWGECRCEVPAPYHYSPIPMVWRDGGVKDYASDCDFYKPKEQEQ